MEKNTWQIFGFFSGFHIRFWNANLDRKKFATKGYYTLPQILTKFLRFCVFTTKVSNGKWFENTKTQKSIQKVGNRPKSSSAFLYNFVASCISFQLAEISNFKWSLFNLLFERFNLYWENLKVIAFSSFFFGFELKETGRCEESGFFDLIRLFFFK